MEPKHIDVLVVGAGISGICAGYYLQTQCPERTWTILEGRDRLGGTWDLFRYPGIRSDSDMYTLGFSFRPWVGENSIVDGGEILQYLKETAATYGIDEKIEFDRWVQSASWSSEDSRWTVEVTERSTETCLTYTCNFLFLCSGYYNYEEGYMPDFSGIDDFQGQVIHPQKWPEDLDYTGQRIVVIGSGATAVTLVPSLAEQAKHVVMLQRSPSYVLSRPRKDPVAKGIQKVLPARLASSITRWKNILLSMFMYRLSRKRPEKIKMFLQDQIREAMGPDYPIEPNFQPRYKPWDQRLCLVPDGDLFDALRTDKASIVTDEIETFTERGLRLRSGSELEADIIVAATGLNLLFLGGMTLSVDGEEVVSNQLMTYKGAMFGGVPNFAYTFGYTNASWTLKCELTCKFVMRLLNQMRQKKARCVTPQLDDSVQELDFSDLSSNYIQRAKHLLPKQGDRDPWRLHQNFLRDLFQMQFGKIEDGVLEFK